MKDQLAESVLAEVMGWGPEQVAEVGPVLQMLATHKYDSYEGYRPGVKFLENLSGWLAQFPSDEERRTVLRFILDDLVFISRAELDHLIETVYPDIIRPMIIAEAALRTERSRFAVTAIAASPTFHTIQRKLLILALSDGARIDRLRRSSPGLSHEQIFLATDVGDMIKEALSSLRSALQDDTARFEQVLLVDDFYGSGTTLLRDSLDPPPSFKGRLMRARDTLDGWQHKDILSDDFRVSILVYVVSSTAVAHVEEMLNKASLEWDFRFVQLLPEAIKVTDTQVVDVCEWHYDEVLVDQHKPHRAPLGFGDAALPVVLAHNAPNNSVCILWADTTDREDGERRRALFPRYERHREDRA